MEQALDSSGAAARTLLDRIVIDGQCARAGIALQRRPTLEGMFAALGSAAGGAC